MKHINKLKYKGLAKTLKHKAEALMKQIETGNLTQKQVDDLFYNLVDEHPEITKITHTVKYETVYQIEE